MARMILPVPAGPAGPGGRLESAEASSSWISWDLMGSKGTHMDMGKCMGKSWKMMENGGKVMGPGENSGNISQRFRYISIVPCFVTG